MTSPMITIPFESAHSTKSRSTRPSWPERPSVTVVVPAMNEEKNLPHVLPSIPEWVDEVILVDGNSKDNTIQVARDLMPDIRVVQQSGKGKGVALRDGFAAATCDIIIMIDADGSMAPSEMFSYVTALMNGADFVKGSRFMQGGGTDDMEFYRYLGNWGLTMMVRLLFGGNYSDLCYGYAAFWRRVLPELNLESDGFEIETEMNVRALKSKLKIVEVPSFEAPRIHGTSNLNTIKDGFRVLGTILKERFLVHNHRAEKEEVSDPVAIGMDLLYSEAQHLVRCRRNFTDTAYEAAVSAVKDAAWHLLTMEHDDPEAMKTQKHYMKRIDNLLDFLEAEASISA